MNPLIKSITVYVLAGITVVLCYKFPNAALAPETGMLLVLPEEIPGHVAYDREISAEEKKWLPADTGMLKRTYYPRTASSQEEALMGSVSATLILSGTDKRSLHRPEVCLVGQGWTVKSELVTTLDLNGKALKVKDLHLERMIMQADDSLKKAQGHYVYWWEGSKTSTPETIERALISVKENVFFNRNTRWGYPSVMTYVDLEKGEGREDAQKRAYDFIEAYAPSFLKNY